MTDRRLLFSLLLLPACEPAVSTEDDPQVPDGGDPEAFASSCEAFFESYAACYEAYGYGSTGSYDPSTYAQTYCEMYQQEAMAYGEACVGAYEEVFACMSSLGCEALAGDDSADAEGFVPEPCGAVFLDAVNRCPELFSQCGSYGLGFDAGCDVEVSGCLDGNTYAVSCGSPEGASQTCSCSVNGAETREVTVAGDLECGGTAWGEEVESACEFPSGTL